MQQYVNLPSSSLVRPSLSTIKFASVIDPFVDQMDFMYAVEAEPYMTMELAALYKSLDLRNPVHVVFAAVRACTSNHALVLKQLFRFGLTSDCKDSRDRPLFFRLKATEPFFQDCCLLFEAHGAKLCQPSVNGTAFWHYCFSVPSSTTLANYLSGKWYTSFIQANIDFLHQRGFSWDCQDHAGRTPLTLVACDIALRMALGRFASPRLAFSKTTCIKFLFEKSAKALAMLFEYGLDPLAMRMDGSTLLSLAVKHEALTFLEVAFACVPSCKSAFCVPSGWTPVVEAAFANSSVVLNLLFRLHVSGPFDLVSFSTTENEIPLAVLCARKFWFRSLMACIPELQTDDQILAVLQEILGPLTSAFKGISEDLYIQAEDIVNKLQQRREELLVFPLMHMSKY